jgi:hypothetical protein
MLNGTCNLYHLTEHNLLNWNILYLIISLSFPSSMGELKRHQKIKRTFKWVLSWNKWVIFSKIQWLSETLWRDYSLLAVLTFWSSRFAKLENTKQLSSEVFLWGYCRVLDHKYRFLKGWGAEQGQKRHLCWLLTMLLALGVGYTRMLVLFFFFFWDRVSICNSSWPQTLILLS